MEANIKWLVIQSIRTEQAELTDDEELYCILANNAMAVIRLLLEDDEDQTFGDLVCHVADRRNRMLNSLVGN